MNVLSTFNGMGCVWLALDKQGIKVNKRYSSEIDKYANHVNDKNYPDTIQLGDITKVKAKDLEKIDLFVGGSPCQGFSFAGKQLAFDDPRSKLFFEFVRLWNEIKKINPDAKFLLENVQMKKNELRIISEYMSVFPVNINSNLVSAQNRNRWYWTNIRTKKVGLFDEVYTDIPQPKDKGILLKDILQPESEINEKYFLTIKGCNYANNAIFKQDRPKLIGAKASCLQAARQDILKVDKQGNKKADQNKAGCLTASGHSGGNHSDMDIICVSQVGRRIDKNGIRKDYDKTIPAIQRLEPNVNNKTNCLTSVTKDNLIIQINPSKESENQPYQQNRIYDINGQMPALMSECRGKIACVYKLRRLTPIECERLQTVPDNYTNFVSDSQRYKMLGNGWTVDVIAHILNNIN